MLSFCPEIERKMHIVLVYRCYNDGTAYYNLTFCTKNSLMTDLGLVMGLSVLVFLHANIV